jgi:hydroxypyruvate isomerase
MPRFCANLGFLFTEVPYLDRFAASAKAGFSAVESSTPYDVPAEQIAEQLSRHKLKMVLINLPAGKWAEGERGLTCLPDRVGEFQDAVAKGISYAKVLGHPILNCLAGIKPPNLSHEKAWDCLISNLRFAGQEIEKAGLSMVVEPINFYDMPGFFLNTSAQALRAIDAAGVAATKLQYDIYHMQRMEGELANTIRQFIARIGHVQVAGNPGRTEPDRGEIDCGYLFDLLDQLGYHGWIGAEYKPTTAGDFAWLKRWNTP